MEKKNEVKKKAEPMALFILGAKLVPVALVREDGQNVLEVYLSGYYPNAHFDLIRIIPD